MTTDTPKPIRGGLHVRDIPGTGQCIDILQMMYNWRLVVAEGHGQNDGYLAGWCYYGHSGRSMADAYLAALTAASAWDGTGTPAGFDKEAFDVRR